MKIHANYMLNIGEKIFRNFDMGRAGATHVHWTVPRVEGRYRQIKKTQKTALISINPLD